MTLATVIRIGTKATALAVLALTAALAAACGSTVAGPTGVVSDGKGRSRRCRRRSTPCNLTAEEVGGERVRVTNLTPPGAEPHDVELAPRSVAKIEDADLVVYLKGFSPAVDDAIAQKGASEPKRSTSHQRPISWRPTATAAGAPTPTSGSTPLTWPRWPTSWPLRLAAIDSANAADFAANASTLHLQLGALDNEFEAGLDTCTSKYLVTSHAAFGYLTRRYGLEQHAITGLGAEGEPTPRDPRRRRRLRDGERGEDRLLRDAREPGRRRDDRRDRQALELLCSTRSKVYATRRRAPTTSA